MTCDRAIQVSAKQYWNVFQFLVLVVLFNKLMPLYYILCPTIALKSSSQWIDNELSHPPPLLGGGIKISTLWNGLMETTLNGPQKQFFFVKQ